MCHVGWNILAVLLATLFCVTKVSYNLEQNWDFDNSDNKWWLEKPFNNINFTDPAKMMKEVKCFCLFQTKNLFAFPGEFKRQEQARKKALIDS